MLCFHHVVSKKIEFVTYHDGYLKIQDYAYHIIITKAFWFDGFGDIYKLTFQQQALSAYIDSQIYTVMPLGITPIALVVWLPFAFVSIYSMALSYTLWMTLSLFILFTALWSIGRNLSLKESLPLLPITLSLVTLFSVTTFFTIMLGQTSILAAGLLIYLIYFLYEKDKKPISDNFLIFLLLVFILGMKPTYITLGLGLLIIYGRWREALYSILIVFFFLIAITPLLTLDWVPSYLNLLRMYSHGNFPEFYSWAIVPETMNIFSSAFLNIIGDNIASLISFFFIYSVYICIVGLSFLPKIKKKPIEQIFLLRITREQLFVLFIATYLLFAPYAGGYEDILFLPVFITVSLYGDTPSLTSYKSLTLTCILFVILLIIFFNSAILIYTILKIRVMAIKKELADHAFGLTIVAMLLLSPITWGHIFPVLILPLSILLRDYIRDHSPRKLRILLFIILLLSLPDVLIARGLMAIHHPFRMPWYSMLLTLGPSAGLVLLWIVLIHSSSIGRVRQTP